MLLSSKEIQDNKIRKLVIKWTIMRTIMSHFTMMVEFRQMPQGNKRVILQDSEHQETGDAPAVTYE